MSRAWLDLGTNLQREQSLQAAVAALARHVRVIRSSPVYESAPVGFLDQPDFWNVCVEIDSELPALELRALLRQLEDELGRMRTENKYGPRNIDMDLVLHQHEVGEKLPHPQVESQLFVLQPLCDLIPEHVHPHRQQPLCELLTELQQRRPDDQLRPVAVEGFPLG